MAKRAYIGVSGKARRIKKGYIGVGGKARKIKKAYIGVGGVARPFWAGNTLSYYGTATALSEARYQLAATTVGNYALFAGGEPNGLQQPKSAVVDAYTSSLTRSTPTALSQARSRFVGTHIGNYALFGGGFYRASGTASIKYHTTVDAYSTSLTRSTPTGLSQAGGFNAATSVGNYAIFGGGNGSGTISSYVDAYNTSLVKTTAAELSVARGQLAATTVGNYALFGGGEYTNAVDAYNSSLVKSTVTELTASGDGYWNTIERESLAATTVGDYALFAGGFWTGAHDAFGYDDYVDAYNTSLVKSTATSLSEPKDNLAATTLGDYALFGGGWISGNKGTATVDAYNLTLTRSKPTSLSVARIGLAATTVGDYALFGGGGTSSTNNPQSTVDAYTLV